MEQLSELSGTYVDIVFSQSLVDENYYKHFNFHIGTRSWNNPRVSADTENAEQYLANYEAYLDEQGITDRELWVFEPAVTPPWAQ